MNGFSHHLEGVGEQGQGGLAGIGEQDLASGPPEQGAGKLLKLTDLLRNRARRDVQFFRRPGERQMARCGSSKARRGVEVRGGGLPGPFLQVSLGFRRVRSANRGGLEWFIASIVPSGHVPE